MSTTTTIRKLRYYPFEQQHRKQVQICYYNRPILYQQWYSCFNHGTSIRQFQFHYYDSYRQRPIRSNYYHTLQQQSNTIWNRSLIVSISHINTSSSWSSLLLLQTTIRTKWSISLSDNNDETKSTTIHDNNNDDDNNNNDDDDENQTNNKNNTSHTDDVDTSTHKDTSVTNSTNGTSSSASTTNTRMKKEKKGTILDISTYHGWDCMDAQDTTSNIDGMTIMKKEIAEWDPIRKKIVKKVITSIVKQPSKKTTTKYGITTTTTEDNIAAQFTYDGKNLRTKELNAIRRAKIKAARKNPTSKHCKMCPICHKHFIGHNSMVSHLLYREKCVSVLDPIIKDILIKQKKNQQKKSLRRKLRRKHLPIYSDSSDDSDTDDDSDIDDNNEKDKNNAKQKGKKKVDKKDENKGDTKDVNEVNDVEVNINEDNNHKKSDEVVIQQTST